MRSFLVTESEAITYHYELDLRPEIPGKPDPRIAHTLNLHIDEYGNVLQSVAVVYPRFGKFEDGSLEAGRANPHPQGSKRTPSGLHRNALYQGFSRMRMTIACACHARC